MTKAITESVLTGVKRYVSFTLQGPVPGVESCMLRFKWSLQEGEEEPLGYDWELQYPDDPAPFKKSHGSGSWYQSLLPPDLAPVAEALLSEWPAYSRDIYPRVPPLPKPIGSRHEAREAYFDYKLCEADPIQGSESTFIPQRVSIHWYCHEGADRSWDRYFFYLSASTGREFWSGGIGNTEESSQLPMPPWLWNLAEECRLDLLAWNPVWKDL